MQQLKKVANDWLQVHYHSEDPNEKHHALEQYHFILAQTEGQPQGGVGTFAVAEQLAASSILN